MEEWTLIMVMKCLPIISSFLFFFFPSTPPHRPPSNPFISILSNKLFLRKSIPFYSLIVSIHIYSVLLYITFSFYISHFFLFFHFYHYTTSIFSSHFIYPFFFKENTHTHITLHRNTFTIVRNIIQIY